MAYGGAKAPHKVKTLASDISVRLRALTEKFMISHPVRKGDPKDPFDYGSPWLTELRRLWVDELEECTSDPVIGDVVSTPLRYSLIKR